MRLAPSFYNPAARDRIGATEVVFWVLPVAAYFVFPDDLSFATHVLIMMLLAMSLGLILGFAGILTLGHAVFFGIGAYSAGLLAVHGYTEPISVTVFAGILAAAFALILGPLVLRLTGLPLMMMTLAIAAILFEAANKATWLTGGDNGMGGVKFDPILGLFKWSIYGQTGYLYTLAWVFGLFVMMRRLVASPFGLALQGIRENATRMRLIGAPVTGDLIIVYCLSAFMAGIAGALSAATTGFVGLNVLSTDLSINVLVMLVLGGITNIYGGLVGGALYIVLQNFASDWDPYNWMFFVGVFLVAVVLLGQNGVLGLIDQVMPSGKQGADRGDAKNAEGRYP